MVRWLCLLTHDLHYCLEVFFRATNLLDTFLSLVKVSLWFIHLQYCYISPRIIGFLFCLCVCVCARANISLANVLKCAYYVFSLPECLGIES